jgi:hypothetical protein
LAVDMMWTSRDSLDAEANCTVRHVCKQRDRNAQRQYAGARADTHRDAKSPRLMTSQSNEWLENAGNNFEQRRENLASIGADMESFVLAWIHSRLDIRAADRRRRHERLTEVRADVRTDWPYSAKAKVQLRP